MIVHDYKCIFIHIPKAAGQSIENFFLDKLNVDWAHRAPFLLAVNNDPNVGPPRLAHLKAIDYTAYHYISTELYQQYFKFSFVRNPWSRTVSFYKYLGYSSIISFETFVKYQLPKLLQKKNYFLMPQYNFLYHKENLMVDFVGKFENLNSDFSKVCSRLGFSETTLHHINKAEKKTFKGLKNLSGNPHLLSKIKLSVPEYSDFKDYFSDKSKDCVYKLYRNDIESFEYEFG